MYDSYTKFSNLPKLLSDESGIWNQIILAQNLCMFTEQKRKENKKQKTLSYLSLKITEPSGKIFLCEGGYFLYRSKDNLASNFWKLTHSYKFTKKNVQFQQIPQGGAKS